MRGLFPPNSQSGQKGTEGKRNHFFNLICNARHKVRSAVQDYTAYWVTIFKCACIKVELYGLLMLCTHKDSQPLICCSEASKTKICNVPKLDNYTKKLFMVFSRVMRRLVYMGLYLKNLGYAKVTQRKGTRESK